MNFARIIPFAIFILCALSAQAQLSANQGIGAFSLGGGGNVLSSQGQKNGSDQAKLLLLDGHIYRRVNGEIVNFLVNGGMIYGTVETSANGIIILEKSSSYGESRFALTNYQDEAISGRAIEACVVRVGVYNDGDTPLELWDCGVLLSPEEEEEQKINEAIAARTAQQNAIAEAARQKNFLLQSNAMASLLPHATNGEGWAQTGVAIHYLNGQGCETNTTLGVFWLQKAAAQGDSEASNVLARINLASTNTVSVGSN